MNKVSALPVSVVQDVIDGDDDGDDHDGEDYGDDVGDDNGGDILVIMMVLMMVMMMPIMMMMIVMMMLIMMMMVMMIVMMMLIMMMMIVKFHLYLCRSSRTYIFWISLAYLLSTACLLILRVGPSSPPAIENSAGRITNFLTWGKVRLESYTALFELQEKMWHSKEVSP